MKDYQLKFEKLHRETVKEGIVSDYVMYQTLKNWFDVPNMPFYQFGLLKGIISKFLRDKGLQA